MQTPFSPHSNTVPYRDRASAGRWLAKEIQSRSKLQNAVVLAIPRGGVLVGAEIASALQVPLDVFVVRRILLADDRSVGAMASGGVCVLRPDILKTTDTEAVEIAEAVSEVREEVLETERRYRQGRPVVNVQGRTVILVDDGAASGGSLPLCARSVLFDRAGV